MSRSSARTEPNEKCKKTEQNQRRLLNGQQGMEAEATTMLAETAFAGVIGSLGLPSRSSAKPSEGWRRERDSNPR
jgi:1-deoxy-D-xylulose 5-phosphate reductoisomerase